MIQRIARSAAMLGLLAVALVPLVGCGLLNSAVNTAVPLASTKLMFSCVPEGTQVDTPSGPRPIQFLRAGEMVIGFDGAPVRILQRHEYAEDPASEFLTVEFAGGERVDLCMMHRIDGLRAGDLSPGDPVAGRTVLLTTHYQGVTRSYDLLTEDAGYRIDGLPVNSMIEEMVAASR